MLQWKKDAESSAIFKNKCSWWTYGKHEWFDCQQYNKNLEYTLYCLHTCVVHCTVQFLFMEIDSVLVLN